jgi:hypothetical protein
MATPIDDYLINQAGIDWSAVLSTWHWLVPKEFTIWFVNRIGDLFLVLDDGTVHMLDVGGGTLQKVADSRDDFKAKIDEGENANEWLAIPLIIRLVAAGVTLKPKECYAFKQLPILGGDYIVENFAPMAIADYLGAYGSIHEQLQCVPDGTKVVLKTTNLQCRGSK